MTNRRRTWETGFPDIRGQGRAIQSRDIQRLPGSQRMSSRSSESMNIEHSSPSSQRRREASRRWLWRLAGSDDHRSATPPSRFPRPCCGLRRVPRRRRPGHRPAAGPPAGAAWQYESTCDSLATALSCKRDERRVGRRQLEAATDWSVESTKACAKPFAGTGERGPPASKAKAPSFFVCELPTQDTRNSLMAPLIWSTRL